MGGNGRHVSPVGMRKDKIIFLLVPPVPNPEEAVEHYIEDLNALDVLNLRRMLDEDAPRERLQCRSIALEFGVLISLTPPYVGKWSSSSMFTLRYEQAARNVGLASR